MPAEGNERPFIFQGQLLRLEAGSGHRLWVERLVGKATVLLSHGLVEMRLMPAHCGHARYDESRQSGLGLERKPKYRLGMRMSRLGQLITRCRRGAGNRDSSKISWCCSRNLARCHGNGFRELVPLLPQQARTYTYLSTEVRALAGTFVPSSVQVGILRSATAFG